MGGVYAVVGVVCGGGLLAAYFFFCFLWRCVQAVGHTFFSSGGCAYLFPLVYILYRLSIVSLSSLLLISMTIKNVI